MLYRLMIYWMVGRVKIFRRENVYSISLQHELIDIWLDFATEFHCASFR